MVFVGTFDFAVANGWIHALHATNGTPAWSNFLSGAAVGSSVGYNNGSVFLTAWDGNLRVWDALTGATLQTILLSSAGSTSSVALGDGYLVVGDEAGKVTGFSFVGAGVPDRVDTSPDSADVVVGGATQFDAVGFDAYNNSVGGTFTWTSMNGLGTVIPLTSSGDEIIYLAGPTAGTDSLEVRLSTFVDNVTVNVMPGPPEQVTIAPGVVDVEAGDTLQFTATTQDQFGNPVNGGSFDWIATGGIGTIDATGLFTASTITGTGTVRVALDDMNATAVVRIVPGPVDEITVSPSTLEVLTGGSADLIAVAKDQHGNQIADATFDWTTTIGTIEATEAGWSATFTAGSETGTGTISVTYGGVSANVDVIVKTQALPITDQVTQPLTLALIAAVAALAGLSAYLYLRYVRPRRPSGEGPEKVPEEEDWL